jgi:hypothetical protein
MRERIKRIHDTALRGLACAIWVTSFIITFFAAIPAVSGGDDQQFWISRAIGCAVVGITAAVIHAYLLIVAKDEENK